MNIITRKEAQAQGLKTYFTGKPCKRGHIAPRAASNWICVECAQENSAAKPKAKKQVPQACEVCGTHFTPSRKRTRLFCSDQCRWAASSSAKSRLLQERLRWIPGYIARSDAKAKGLTMYFTATPCPSGHVVPRYTSTGSCLLCLRAAAVETASNPVKAERRKTLNRLSQRRRAVDPSWKASRSASSARHALTFKERNNCSRSAWVYRNNPQARLATLIRSRCLKMISKQGGKKASRTLDLLGAPIGFVRLHLEAQFSDGMSWENMGEWHIDHIRPCASFDLTDPAQQRLCFHYTNLQPLWAEDNIRKGAKLAA